MITPRGEHKASIRRVMMALDAMNCESPLIEAAALIATKLGADLDALFVETHEQLKLIDEGNGTVYDNTTIVHWNELAQGDTHSISECMVILAGGSNFFRKGRYLDLAGQSRRAFSNVLVSCFHAMGYSDVTAFGDPRLASGTGPLSGLT